MNEIRFLKNCNYRSSKNQPKIIKLYNQTFDIDFKYLNQAGSLNHGAATACSYPILKCLIQ